MYAGLLCGKPKALRSEPRTQRSGVSGLPLTPLRCVRGSDTPRQGLYIATLTTFRPPVGGAARRDPPRSPAQVPDAGRLTRFMGRRLAIEIRKPWGNCLRLLRWGPVILAL